MADITMCRGTGCPVKENCYRHKALESKRQSWVADVPYDPKRQTCLEYWPMITKEPLIKPDPQGEK